MDKRHNYRGSSNVIEELILMFCGLPFCLHKNYLSEKMVLHVIVVYSGQRNRLGRNAPEHPSLIDPKYSKQDTPGACEKNLILSVKTAHAIIFQCLEKLTVQKTSSFYVSFHNRVLLQGRALLSH